MPMGMPCSGPRNVPFAANTSSSAACRRAPSASTSTQAWIWLSNRSIRARQSLTRLVADVVPARNCAAAWLMVIVTGLT
jgi:hypothetical protein